MTPTSASTPLARLLREQLAAQRLSYGDVETRGGPSRQTVSNLINRWNGQRSPDPATIRGLAFALGIPERTLRDAVDDGLLERSPMPAGKGGVTRRVVDPAELLTVEQVRQWDAALPPHARGLALVAGMTGLRQGELLGLRAPAVDWLRRQVRVDEQLQTPAGGGPAVYGPPKTAAGVRTVPLPGPAAEALAEHVRLYPSPDGEPLFLAARGGRWRRQTFGDVWRDARDRAGLPGWAHWHALRDVAASTYIRGGTDVRTVMALLGHTSSEETLTTYSRLWPDAQDRARQAAEALWAPADGQSMGTGRVASGLRRSDGVPEAT